MWTTSGYLRLFFDRCAFWDKEGELHKGSRPTQANLVGSYSIQGICCLGTMGMKVKVKGFDTHLYTFPRTIPFVLCTYIAHPGRFRQKSRHFVLLFS